MKFHKNLTLNRWKKLTLIEQMANIGMDVDRAIKWKKKGNPEQSKAALYRGLELLWLTIEDPKNQERLKELTRLREILNDYFFCDNIYKSSEKLWRNYFYPFSYAARVIQ
jgi:hypothetical protein